MTEIIRYSNGLKVSVDTLSVRSIACGIWAGVGSNLEDASNNGISHFTEHMMFKGTDKMSAFDIANAFESLGANINAFTGKECTCYYSKTVDEYAEKSFELLCHIYFDSAFDADELNKERKVIVEEINMVEDAPEDICHDKIMNAIYGDKGLGKTILGPSENVLRFTGDDVRAHIEKFYIPSNTVVSFSGNITVEMADKLVRKYFLPRVKEVNNCVPKMENTQNSRVYLDRIKDFEQSNIEIAFPSFKLLDTKLDAVRALITTFGGGMSSRLFQSVREQQGLAYSVYATQSIFADSGILDICLNISRENTEKAVRAVKEEIDKLVSDGITQSELDRAKVQLKSSLVFGNENVLSLMVANGKRLLLCDKIDDIDETIKSINALTVGEINDVARALFNYDKVCAAYVGKSIETDILGILR